MAGMLEWSAGLPVVSYTAGAEVIREGELLGALLVLVEGSVEILKHGAMIYVIDEPGTTFGEISVLLGGPATATVRSVGDTRFRRSDDPHRFLVEQPGVALDVATSLARRLDRITGYLADLRNQYGDRADQLGLVDTVLETLSHHQRTADPGSDREPDAPY